MSIYAHLRNSCLSCFLSETLTITRNPDTTTKVVIGDNNRGLLLVWNYSFEAEETILRVAFKRQKPGEIQLTKIAKIDDN